ncbi:MAG: helix-turn-helix domain-containing protein [Gemmatimonadota bacterium]|nr:helix-turn-helix domain-containing protein [Gemmatimonadota bacterium]
MVRERDPKTLERLVDAALRAFIEDGYRRTKVARIARDAGIAPGTVYLYVEGKEALFELALRRAFLVPDTLDVDLPYRGAPLESRLGEIWERLMATEPLARLAEAEATDAPEDPAAEFEALLKGVFRWQARYWRGIALIESCAREWPELFLLFYRRFRREALERAARHLERRASTGHYRAFSDPRAAAYLIMENIGAFAMTRHLAPDIPEVSDELAERTVVEVLVAAFVPGGPERLGARGRS